MTPDSITSILPALSALNSWCRVPYAKNLGMSEAARSIYAYKLHVIKEAVRLGMTSLKPVLVNAKCKTCKGTGTYHWESWNDPMDDRYEACRTCRATGDVTLHFIETEIAGVRWHSPLPHRDHDIHRFTSDDWKTAAVSEWKPGAEGRALERFYFIQLVNTVETAIATAQFIRHGANHWWSLHLGDMTWKGCVFCGKIQLEDGRLPYAGSFHRPGFKWRQPACWDCRGSKLSWPYDLKQQRHRPDDIDAWREKAPIPEEAYQPEVTEWLARRGIIIGAIPPGDFGYTHIGDCCEVLAVSPSKYLVRIVGNSIGSGLTTEIDTARLTPRPVRLLEAARV
jgi:hypothetical protein